MFAPKGWISLNEIYFLISSIFHEKGHIGPIKFFGDENFEVTWLYMEEAPEVAVCLTNGETLPIARMLIHADNPYNNLNNHIDLMVGTVGSAHAPQHSEKPLDQSELRRRYGPFLHLPIIFPKSDFIEFFDNFECEPQAFMAPNRTENKAQQRAQQMAPRAISKKIVELCDNGELTTFDEAKSMLGGGLSVRGFRLAWTLASEKRPQISKPGRKPKKPKS
jgi:hypothetical protein